MWKDSIRNIVVIFQTKILRIVRFYVRRSAIIEIQQIGYCFENTCSVYAAME